MRRKRKGTRIAQMPSEAAWLPGIKCLVMPPAGPFLQPSAVRSMPTSLPSPEKCSIEVLNTTGVPQIAKDVGQVILQRLAQASSATNQCSAHPMHVHLSGSVTIQVVTTRHRSDRCLEPPKKADSCKFTASTKRKVAQGSLLPEQPVDAAICTDPHCCAAASGKWFTGEGLPGLDVGAIGPLETSSRIVVSRTPACTLHTASGQSSTSTSARCDKGGPSIAPQKTSTSKSSRPAAAGVANAPSHQYPGHESLSSNQRVSSWLADMDHSWQAHQAKKDSVPSPKSRQHDMRDEKCRMAPPLPSPPSSPFQKGATGPSPGPPQVPMEQPPPTEPRPPTVTRPPTVAHSRKGSVSKGAMGPGSGVGAGAGPGSGSVGGSVAPSKQAGKAPNKPSSFYSFSHIGPSELKAEAAPKSSRSQGPERHHRAKSSISSTKRTKREAAHPEGE